MNKYEITKKIEDFAPLSLSEKWDCSGWIAETSKAEINKILLCLTVTDAIIRQAKLENCDLVISHHPLFKINCPSELVDKNFHPQIDIYCAHTNMDMTEGGTTDTLIRVLNLNKTNEDGFVRFVELEKPIKIEDFTTKLAEISPNLRFTNPNSSKTVQKIGFCSGSGTEFIDLAIEHGADTFVSGDLKFHTAVDSPIVVFDIGHFESEIIILDVIKEIIGSNVEIIKAFEESPLKYRK